MSKSKPKVRHLLKKSTTNREYKINVINFLYPPYSDYDYNWKHGMPRYKLRSYKTWKHTRKTQWKD
jgi:hypothetical protein